MRVRADAMNYVSSKEAESNAELLTPEYIQLQVGIVIYFWGYDLYWEVYING